MNKIILLFPFVIQLLISSCSLPTYFPSTVNAPQLSNKGEFTGVLSVGDNTEIKTSYAITKNIGIVADYTYSSKKYSADAEHLFLEIMRTKNTNKPCFIWLCAILKDTTNLSVRHIQVLLLARLNIHIEFTIMPIVRLWTQDMILNGV